MELVRHWFITTCFSNAQFIEYILNGHYLPPVENLHHSWDISKHSSYEIDAICIEPEL